MTGDGSPVGVDAGTGSLYIQAHSQCKSVGLVWWLAAAWQ